MNTSVYVLLEIALAANDANTARALMQTCKVFFKYAQGDAYGLLFRKYGNKCWDTQASSGDLKALQWLHANRSEGCTAWAMNYAARNGHLEVMQWLHANRSEGCTKEAMNDAARNGH